MSMSTSPHLLFSAHRFDQDSIVNHFHIPTEILVKILLLKKQTELFDQALKHAAYGELNPLQTLLENEPLLVLLYGKTSTPNGIILKDTSLLECALLGGDPQLAAMILPYFDQFAGGNTAREWQISRCRQAIASLNEQRAENLTWLFDIIKASSLKDVAEELATGDAYKPYYQSKLREALNQFRNEKLNPEKRCLSELQMHCNYQNLIHAHKMINDEWGNLKVKVWKKKINTDKLDLVARQIIGFIQLVELPALERYACAQNKMRASEALKDVDRSFAYKYKYGSFPCFDAAKMRSRNGIGFHSYVTIYGWPTPDAEATIPGKGVLVFVERYYQKAMKEKISLLQNLCDYYTQPMNRPDVEMR